VAVSYTAEQGGTVTPTSYDIVDVAGSMPAGNLPVRLWGVARGESNSQFSQVSAGVGDGVVRHSISELCLIEAVGLSRVQDEWPDCMRYSDAVNVAMQAARAIYARSEITGLATTRGVFEWPESGGDFFYGTRTVVYVTEYQ